MTSVSPDNSLRFHPKAAVSESLSSQLWRGSEPESVKDAKLEAWSGGSALKTVLPEVWKMFRDAELCIVVTRTGNRNW